MDDTQWMWTMLIAAAVVVMLSGCATPVTHLRGPDGQMVSCGGDRGSSAMSGLAGYIGQEGKDEQCVKSYQAQGYVRINNPYPDPSKIQP